MGPNETPLSRSSWEPCWNGNCPMGLCLGLKGCCHRRRCRGFTGLVRRFQSLCAPSAAKLEPTAAVVLTVITAITVMRNRDECLSGISGATPRSR